MNVSPQEQLKQFQFLDKYARYNWDLGRRETWEETVLRTVEYLRELSNDILPNKDYDRIHKAILEKDVMPSMRLVAMAGPAARRQNLSVYNCSALPVDSIDSYAEALNISMSGCGVGFSVESRFVSKLPPVKRQTGIVLPPIVVEDTTEGWVKAVKDALTAWFCGYDVTIDYSKIRPAGSILYTKGGRASGPTPLKEALEFARKTILRNQGGRIRPIDAHDMMCYIGNAAVSGGTRRTAMISLFDMDDYDMLYAKSPENMLGNNQRWNANNSVVVERRLGISEISTIMDAMYEGKSGEPGIFSRIAAENTKPQRRSSSTWMTNPCGEIVLRPRQLCNLSAIIARPHDTTKTLLEKIEIAAIIGTIQSMATYFPGMSKEWKNNAEEERLLGVSIDGQMDTKLVRKPSVQRALKEAAIKTNKKYAKILHINESAAVTCVKPSGNTSVLVDSSPGIHARWSKYYIRNVRVGNKTPMYYAMRESGVHMIPENGQTKESATAFIVGFPIKSPDGAITRGELSATEQLNYWLSVKTNYTEHNPSATITYKENEKDTVTQWVYDNQDVIGGLSFLPYSDFAYENAPYVEITEEEYKEALSRYTPINFDLMRLFETEDQTTAAQELSCFAGACELQY